MGFRRGGRTVETHLLFDPAADSKWPHFLRHLVEMIVVMMLGMCVLGGTFRELHVIVFGSGFAAAWRDHAGLAAFGMAFSMTVPMVLWMRYRGHSWERGGEMALAMNLPVLAVLGLYEFDVVGFDGVLGLQMGLMIPAMLAAMLYRKEEYSARQATHRPRRRLFTGVLHS
jgi:hypothetical protein